MKKKTKILYIPTDERPCNYIYPKMIVDMAEPYKIKLPPYSLLGKKKIPPKFTELRSFIIKESKNADILVMSLDTFLYGGLIPSRLHHYKVDTVLKHLETIKEIKKNNPKLKLYVYSSIMRCPTYSTNEEEPDYYGICGKEIHEYGIAKHKHMLHMISDEEFAKEEAIIKPYKKYVLDYEKRREINILVNIAFIEYAKKYCDYFILPQDDSAPFGYTAIDQIKYKEALKENNFDVEMYPGSDDVGMTMIARAISDNENVHPDIEVIYPKEICSKIIPMYEDRPIEKTLASQFRVVGFNPVKKSDNKLFMNYPTHDMVNMGSAPSKGYIERDLDGFTDKIAKSANEKHLTIICDGAYGNGGEHELLSRLRKKCDLYDVIYAGWNTSSNALGTALAEGMMWAIFGGNEAHNNFLALRIYEDIGYMGHVRWHVWHDVVGKHGFSYEFTGPKHGVISKIVNEETNEFIEKEYPEIYKKYKISDCYMPWQRIFETCFIVKKR